MHNKTWDLVNTTIMRKMIKHKLIVILVAGIFLYSGLISAKEIKPSSKVLDSAGVKEFIITDKIKVTIGNGKNKSAQGCALCENSSLVSLSAALSPKLKVENYSKVRAVIETKKTQRVLFTLVNEGGLRENSQNL